METVKLRVILAAILIVSCVAALQAQAGGSGLNTVVVLNQNSSNSCELANYFCERRQVPPENVLRISWAGGNISWSSAEFQAQLVDPLLAMLADRQLTNQIDYLVLSMDIPFQTVNGPVVNSTTSALFYGARGDSTGLTNSYAASENVFQNNKPASAPGYSFLTTMITAGSLAQAKRLVDLGVAGDGTFPSNPVVLAKSSDPLRNIRYHAFDNAIFNTRVRGNYSMERTNSDLPAGLTGLLGYQTGLAGFSVSPGTFVPGAMADSLTSYGGLIFGPNGQTSLLEFINAGASGSYGTVTEPSPDPQKFPDPQVYFYQSRGFNLAECYYQSLVSPYQGLIVAEPLAAPFARSAAGQWLGVSSNAVLTGSAPLSLQFSAADSARPLQQIDLFVDGKYFRTLTNLPPQPGNRLSLAWNGYAVSYVVPAGATLASIANDFTALINSTANTNTPIAATNHGDRIELHYVSTNLLNRPTPPSNLRTPGTPGLPAGTPPPYLASSSIGTAALLGTFLEPSRNFFLSSPALGIKACSVSGTMQVGAWLQITVIKTNGTQVRLSVTNQSATATPYDLTGQLVSLINSKASLQGPDGITAEDYNSSWFGSALFNLRAQKPGLAAAAVKITLAASANLVISPKTQTGLDDNLPDLQPRNHLYVTAGATDLSLAFNLDTTTLADGFHELTAVAYEGSHVRTQTRTTLSVRVQNSPLAATLTPVDLVDASPVQGIYHIQVTANTNNIRAITLFSTGGALGTISNLAAATFTVYGPNLGAGLHPFYAVIETTTGGTYRTEIQRIRLIN